MSTQPNELILGTAGHIDHGKTALVKALTGIDTDRLPDEKRRGITIDLGFARIVEGDRRISVIDVPGHERFVRNMLAGAGGFDMALLVIAADDGVMPQTREHLEILDLLGIKHGFVAMTKCDLAAEAWQDLVEDDIREHLRGTGLWEAPIVRVSAATGQGVDTLRRAIVDVAAVWRRRERPSPFRLSVDRVFVKPGQGVVVTGSVGAGVIRPGEEVEIFPGLETGRVRALQVHGESAESATTGQRLALNLTGVKGESLGRGAEIAAPGFLRDARIIGVRLKPARGLTDPFRNRAQYECHIGTAQVSARMILPPAFDPHRGDGAIALLALAEPIATVHGRPFVLRTISPARTIGGGHVIQSVGRIVRRRDAAAWRAIDQLDASALEDRLEAWMTLTHAPRPDAMTAMRELGATTDEIESAAGRLVNLGRLLRFGGSAGAARYELTHDAFLALIDRLRRRVARFHAEHPRLTGMPVPQLISRLPDQPRDLVRSVIDHELARPHFRVRYDLIAAHDFDPKLTRAEKRILDSLRQEFPAGSLTPRLLPEIAAATGTPESTLLELARILVAESAVVEIGGGLFLANESAAAVRERVRAWFAEHPTLTVSELREILGISRKFAVPIAEWLDKSGLTRRDGDQRTLNATDETPRNPPATP